MENSFVKNIRSVFTLDVRALALMRIAISLVLMADLIIRASDLRAFYTDNGVLPLEVLFRYLWNTSYISLYTITGNYYLQMLLFVLNFVCVTCLLLGYRTRLFTFICWLFLLSLHNRNPLVLQAGDDLLRMILFWGLFLPWGYRYSIDSYRNQSIPVRNEYESAACIAYVCQIAFLYYFSAILKSSNEWSTDFTAIYYALSLDQMVTPIGQLIYPYYDLLRVLTAFVYYLELLLPLVLFIPFYNAWFRMALLILVTGLQVNIAMTLFVGLFPFISITSMIGLFPTYFIDKIAARNAQIIRTVKARIRALVLRYYPPPAERTVLFPRTNLFREVVVYVALAYVLAWNMNTVGRNVLPDNLKWVGFLFRVNQHWGMFAPNVFKVDGWYVLRGKTADGQEIDLSRNGAPLTYERPERLSALVPNDRWRKFGENMLFLRNSHFRPYYCQYVLNEWNTRRSEPVQSVEIVYMEEYSLPDYQYSAPKRESLCECRTETAETEVVSK
jgi:hypothetical protein